MCIMTIMGSWVNERLIYEGLIAVVKRKVESLLSDFHLGFLKEEYMISTVWLYNIIYKK